MTSTNIFYKVFIVFMLLVSISFGETYENVITVKFKSQMINIPTGQKLAHLSNFNKTKNNLKTYFELLSPDIQFVKMIPKAIAFDTLYIDKKGEVKFLNDWSQVFIIKISKSNRKTEDIINELNKFEDVEYAEPPVKVKFDFTPDDLHLEGNQWYLTKINAENAWDFTTGDSNIKIAVIEDGVASHDDIDDKLSGGETGSTGAHGLMVAGVAGCETNNSDGLASLGYNTTIVPRNYGTTANSIAADILDAADPNEDDADIINCSFKTIDWNANGYFSYNYQVVEDAVEDAITWGKIVVASAGNPPTGDDLDVVPYTQWPAAYDDVIGVSATNSFDAFPTGYNYGSHVDLSAPGIGIRVLDLNNSYDTVNGTSFSSPLVCALAALIKSININYSRTEIQKILELSAKDLGTSGRDDYYGYGRIDANNAVRNLYVPQVYSTIQSALNAAVQGQTVVIENGDHTLSGNLVVPAGITLKRKSTARIILNSYNVTKASTGSIVIESGYANIPDIRLQSGSTIMGLYPTASSALSASSAGQQVHVRGTYTNSGHLTVSSGKILRTHSGATMKFSSNRYLYVNGTLYGNGTTFTRTSGTWGGIKYQSGSSGSLTNCTINYANCGLYIYNSSQIIESNLVNYSNIYLNNSYSELENNYFNDASGSYLMYIYGGSPTFFYNTIESNTLVTVSTNNGSDPWFGDGESGPPECFGYNILIASPEADGVLWAQGGSTPMLGYGDAGVYYCGYNSIIGSSGYTAAAFGSTTSIDAAWCWWGQYPAPTCYGDVNTSNPLTSNPGGGSSLDKMSAPLNINTSEIAGKIEEANSLLQTALGYYYQKKYQMAVTLLQNIIRTYPTTNDAYKAVNLLLRIGRLHNTIINTAVIDELLSSISDKTMRSNLKAKKVQLYRTKGKYDQSVMLCKDIIKENPESLYETYALFDLFNLFQKDLKDTVLAIKYLETLKQKYPDSELTLIARIDNGEEGIFEKTNLAKQQLIVEDHHSDIKEFTLMPNFPNPFNPTTTFRYTAPWDGILQVEIFNSLGQRVRHFKEMHFKKGSNQLVWNGKNDIGNRVTSGVYIVRFKAVSSQVKKQSFEEFNKVIFLK